MRRNGDDSLDVLPKFGIGRSPQLWEIVT